MKEERQDKKPKVEYSVQVYKSSHAGYQFSLKEKYYICWDNATERGKNKWEQSEIYPRNHFQFFLLPKQGKQWQGNILN